MVDDRLSITKAKGPGGKSNGRAAVKTDDLSTDLSELLGSSLRRLRMRRGLSLERLARASGVSRAMLGQIELSKSVPTITVMWKIARALDVPLSTLISPTPAPRAIVLRSKDSKILVSQDGSFSSRALFPFDGPRRVEFYELSLAPHGLEEAEPHSPGTWENLVVSQGVVEIEIESEAHRLKEGDAIVFEADVPHVYRNPVADPARMYLVMTYAENIG